MEGKIEYEGEWEGHKERGRGRSRVGIEVTLLFCFFNFIFSATCLTTQFTCANRNCVPSGAQCDHYNDCGDDSDEESCSRSQLAIGML